MISLSIWFLRYVWNQHIIIIYWLSSTTLKSSFKWLSALNVNKEMIFTVTSINWPSTNNTTMWLGLWGWLGSQNSHLVQEAVGKQVLESQTEIDQEFLLFIYGQIQRLSSFHIFVLLLSEVVFFSFSPGPTTCLHTHGCYLTNEQKERDQ